MSSLIDFQHVNSQFLRERLQMNETFGVSPPTSITDPLDQPILPSVPPTVPLPVRLQIAAYCYILPVICVIGIVGNLMNVITLASKRLKAVSYMYLRALAVADLLCMLFVLAFVSCEVLNYLGFTLTQSPFYGFYQAHLMLSFINWALATGNAQVLALSLERYISVVFPLSFRNWNSPTRAKKIIFITYLVPALFYIPYAFARYSVGTKLSPDGHTIYMAVDSEISKTMGWQIYKWTREAILRFLPIVVLSVLNAQIMNAFRRRQQMFARLKNREQSNQSRDDTLLYILGGIVTMFFICNVPAALNLLFINETLKKRVDYQIFRAVANLLEIFNHAAQFYIFCVCSTDYRAAFMQKFPCFQAYYINREKIRSFMRRGTPKSNCTEKATANASPTLTKNANEVSSQFSQLNHKRSTTATEGIVSLSYCPPQDAQTTEDIQLASGEEDISDESDSLLHFGILADAKSNELNGTTYL